jgi:hypothetical protein
VAVAGHRLLLEHASVIDARNVCSHVRRIGAATGKRRFEPRAGTVMRRGPARPAAAVLDETVRKLQPRRGRAPGLLVVMAFPLPLRREKPLSPFRRIGARAALHAQDNRRFLPKVDRPDERGLAFGFTILPHRRAGE